jgi:hypothetical protein
LQRYQTVLPDLLPKRWATDVVFDKSDGVKRVMRLLGTTRIDLRQYREGERIKFKLNGNSIKFYDKAYSP